MAETSEIERAVENARQLMARFGIECTTTVDELKLWFQADTLYPDASLDEILDTQLIVVHELVEINEVKNAGLKLTKDVILKNLDAVDTAHLVAATVELNLAYKLGDADHLKSRIRNIEQWCIDESVSEGNQKKYKELLAKTRDALARLEGKAR